VLLLYLYYWLMAEAGVVHLPREIPRFLLGRLDRRGTLQKLHINTLVGTHREGGNFGDGGCGYLKALIQVGLLRATQPPGWTTDPDKRGKPHRNKRGELECFSFQHVELVREPITLPTLRLVHEPMPVLELTPAIETPKPKPVPVEEWSTSEDIASVRLKIQALVDKPKLSKSPELPPLPRVRTGREGLSKLGTLLPPALRGVPDKKPP